MALAGLASAQTTSLSQTKRSDVLNRTQIPQSVHSLARSSMDAGPVDDDLPLERIILVLAPSADQDAKLEALLQSQQNFTSPNYHHWLTPEEFSEGFAPSLEDVETARAWLQRQGLVIRTIARSRRWLEFSGTAGQVTQAFQTKLRHYNVNGQAHIANSSEPSVPSAVASVVRGPLTLHNFFRHSQVGSHYSVRRDSTGKLVPIDPAFTPSGSTATRHYLAPGDVAKIYNFGQLYKQGFDGAGQTIAIIGRQNIELGDVYIFRKAFNLPDNDPEIVMNGPDPGYLATEDGIESTLDVEWSGALAPNAKVKLIVSSSTVTTDGVDLSAAYAVDNNIADVISMSYGSCEQNLGSTEVAFYKSLWQQAAAQGISVMVSSGDNGGAGCDASDSAPATHPSAVNGLASTPYNTAVGGTQFQEGGADLTYWSTSNSADQSSALGYIPEVVWNESCASAYPPTSCSGLWSGSGGISTIHVKPVWQSGPGVPSDGMRDLPDISLTAAAQHDGYLFCNVATQCDVDFNTASPVLNSAGVVGGTSVSSPSMAALIAIIDQKTGQRQGLVNETLYRLAAASDPLVCNSSSLTNPATETSCNFYDITAGNNNVPGLSGQAATPGYDLATGLGSVNAANLASAWNAAALQSTTTTLTVPAATSQHGQPLQINIAVAPTSGAGTPSGIVVLMTDTQGTAGIVNLVNGAFQGLINFLPGGQYKLTAHYGGDGVYASSDSSPVVVNLATEGSTLIVSALTYGSTGPVPIAATEPYGWFIYFHAKVKGASGIPATAGTVTFFDGQTQLSTISLTNAGQAEFVSGGSSDYGASVCLPVGVHSITASFSGNQSLNSSSTTSVIPIMVTKAVPSIFFGQGTPITWSASSPLPMMVWVQGDGPILPTGTVQFLDNGLPSGSPVPVVNASASGNLLLAIGTHVIDVSYSGDGTYLSTSGHTVFSSLTVTVPASSGTATQTTLSAPAIMPAGVPGNFSITVTSTDRTVPTGTVQLLGPMIAATAAPLINGAATIQYPMSLSGTYVVAARYSGDASHASSASPVLTVKVPKTTPTVTLSATRTTVVLGGSTSLVVNIVGSGFSLIPGEMAQFYDSVNGATAITLGTPIELTTGTSRKVITLLGELPIVLPLGTHSITAQYLGNNTMNAVTSNPVFVTVAVATPGFQFSAAPQLLPVIAGQSASALLTITPASGFSATTTIVCGAGLPLNATCSVSPSSLFVNGSPQQATITISTMAPLNTIAASTLLSHRRWPWIVICILFSCIFSTRFRVLTRSSRYFGAVLVTAFALLPVSCGGGSGNTAPAPSAQSSTTTVLTSSTIKAAQGASLTLTASVSSSVSNSSGSVTFFDGNQQLGAPATVSSNRAQLASSILSTGTHVITARYSGDSQNLSSTSAALQQVITGDSQVQIIATGGGVQHTTTVTVRLQ